MLGTVLIALAGSAAQPLQVRAIVEDRTCLVTVYGELVTDEALRALAQSHGKTAVLGTDLRTPYRCIGNTIARLQKAGFKVLDVTSNGISTTRH